MKTCHGCQRELDASQFWRNAAKPDGLQVQCKACLGERNAAAQAANRDRARSYVNKCAEKNRALRRASAKAAYHRDIDASREKALERYSRRKPKVAEYQRGRRKDPLVRLRGRLSNRLRELVKKNAGTFQLVGYSAEELRTHLERQFLKGMSWENMDRWHIDHIVPLSSFTITGPDDPELRRAWALPNLRPLWAKDNIRKGAKLEVML